MVKPCSYRYNDIIATPDATGAVGHARRTRGDDSPSYQITIMVRFCHAGARPPTGDHKTARRLLNDGNELDPGDSDTNQATGH